MNREIGAFVQETSGKRVDLTKPELTICVEICDKNAFVSKEKILGVGGLPVGSAGRVVCLISGGIDSPVAAYMMMNRGAEVVFVHFQNDTQMKHSVERKIAALVRILSAYQGESKLYIVPFGDVQRNIIIGVNSRIRMLIYRRFMVRIACEIAKLEGAKALVLGDSLSQVASQTLENINTVYAVSDRAILSPLIGFNKKDTVALAKKMGTYESSILPYGDCCSFMIAEHPVTHASIEEAARAEDTLDIERLVKSALEKKTEQLVSPDNPASCI
jgi:thiamine biosynthesis protein ThiI